MAFYVPVGCVRFARYCGKMYRCHLFPYGGLLTSLPHESYVESLNTSQNFRPVDEIRVCSTFPAMLLVTQYNVVLTVESVTEIKRMDIEAKAVEQYFYFSAVYFVVQCAPSF